MVSNKLVQIVALAIAESGSRAGQDKSASEPQSAAQRAANLMRCGYVIGQRHERDYHCVIISEENGGKGDCLPPLSEYHEDTGTTSGVRKYLTAERTGTKRGCYVEGIDCVSWGIARL